MLTKKDFESKNEVRWCPGCGDHAVLTTLQKTLPELGVDKDNTLIVAGIGCSSRLPFYIDVNGFHTVHGRAFPIATGAILARPELTTWVVTGDGDGFSIGLSHLIHLLRRNVNVKVLMLNNRIYGLTKGQYSPTSKMGQLSRTSNNGVEDKELNPIEMALTAGATFVARAIDTEAKSLKEIITKANKHKGAAFIEILQNCNVYNDGVFAQIKDKKNQANSILRVEEGKPLIYGVEQEKGLVFNQETFSIETGHAQDSINYRNTKDDFLAKAIAKLDYPDFPVAIGVFKNTITKIFNEESKEQESEALLAKALDKQMTWKV